MGIFAVKMKVLVKILGEEVEVARVLVSRHDNYHEAFLVEKALEGAESVCMQTRDRVQNHMLELWPEAEVKFFIGS